MFTFNVNILVLRLHVKFSAEYQLFISVLEMPCYVMLCYVMLCYVMLCYVMLCYVMLCYVMLCYVMLCYVATSTDLMRDFIETTCY